MSASAHSRSSSGSSQGSDESAKAEQRLEALQKQYEDFVCQNKCFHSDLQKEMLVALHTSNYKLMDVIYKLDIGDNNAAKAPTRYDQGGIQVDRATAMKLGLGVLNGLPHEVKQAMILGTLGELAFPRQGSSILPTTPELSSSSVETKKQSGMSGVHEYSPDIYAHVFCHADGRPMLVSQMQHVLDCLERYKDQLVDNGPNDPPPVQTRTRLRRTLSVA
ncbi:hypothetical protein H2203_005581 [Taxawa tesnikishii (nom. ined.)]|nr:hypothetical protein H2203_005581 [Dothideales sp. JES 119]